MDEMGTQAALLQDPLRGGQLRLLQKTARSEVGKGPGPGYSAADVGWSQASESASSE